jgi:hypothetical protein
MWRVETDGRPTSNAPFGEPTSSNVRGGISRGLRGTAAMAASAVHLFYSSTFHPNSSCTTSAQHLSICSDGLGHVVRKSEHLALRLRRQTFIVERAVTSPTRTVVTNRKRDALSLSLDAGEIQGLESLSSRSSHMSCCCYC